MSTNINVRSLIHLLGNESMNFQLHRIVASGKLSTLEYVELLLKKKKELFGLYQGSNLIGPFFEEDFKASNFLISYNGWIELIWFYNNIPEIYKKIDPLENPIITFDYLNLLVNSFSKREGELLLFKYNYRNRKETLLFEKEQFQFDYFFLFVFIENNQTATIGRLWYD